MGTLEQDLAKLALVSDDDLRAAARDFFVKKMAKEFCVPRPVMEMRLAGSGPFLPRAEKEARNG